MGLLNRLKSLWKSPSGQLNSGRRGDVVTTLKKNYHDLQRLAQQVKTHANLAPYPNISERLNRVGEEKRLNAERLRENIFVLGGIVNESPSTDTFKGKNHWDRMVRDLEDQRNLEGFLRNDILFMDQEVTEVSKLLREIAVTEATHRDVFQELLGKADPQANQT